jgi:hypothetical protein
MVISILYHRSYVLIDYLLVKTLFKENKIFLIFWNGDSIILIRPPQLFSLSLYFKIYI